MHITYDTWKTTEPDWNADEFPPCDLEPEPTEEEYAQLYGRKLRPDLTPEELKRLQEYGSVEFKSAGTTRKL